MEGIKIFKLCLGTCIDEPQVATRMLKIFNFKCDMWINNST